MELKDYIAVEKIRLDYNVELGRIKREYDEALSRLTNVAIPIVVAALLVVLGLYYAKDHISAISKFGLASVLLVFFIVVDFFILYSSWKIDIAKRNADDAMQKLEEETSKKLDDVLASSTGKKKTAAV
jgi:hypothetical protein